ncbi:MAG: hypothetical protein H0V27_10910 [Pyrinomonadaceae bacterium]|jgi:hypothetical protein|nr:hypothetical protein [Pyrinomonadaceae bacterium]
MTFEQKTVRILYKKLLALYPRAFREQMGESMEQTFNDLCNEGKQQTGRRLFGFVLWMFVETAIGIGKEHVLLITQGDTMKTITTDLRSSALISFLLVLPFMILDFWFQIVNKPTALSLKNYSDFTMLFGFLWLLPTAFLIILVPIVRTLRAGNSIMASPINLLFRVAFLALIAITWGSLFIDQLPCFLGVPNCD